MLNYCGHNAGLTFAVQLGNQYAMKKEHKRLICAWGAGLCGLTWKRSFVVALLLAWAACGCNGSEARAGDTTSRVETVSGDLAGADLSHTELAAQQDQTAEAASDTSVADQQPAATWTLSSTAFVDGGPIGKPYVCNSYSDLGKSPPLAWTNAPVAPAFAVTVVDKTAKDFVHWVIWNIPADMKALPENLGPAPMTDFLALQGLNDFGGNGYGGPCPPANGPHHYVFTLHALDQKLGTSSRAPMGQARKDIVAHTVSSVSITAIYEKK